MFQQGPCQHVSRQRAKWKNVKLKRRFLLSEMCPCYRSVVCLDEFGCGFLLQKCDRKKCHISSTELFFSIVSSGPLNLCRDLHFLRYTTPQQFIPYTYIVHTLHARSRSISCLLQTSDRHKTHSWDMTGWWGKLGEQISPGKNDFPRFSGSFIRPLVCWRNSR